jgi:cytochrome c oxidase cbb3-type subunit 2
MKSGPLLFLGIFGTTAFSWAGILLTTIVQQNDSGATKPYYDVANEQMLPAPLPGVARQGQQVYQDLGCVYCHTQQVQNPVRAGEEKSPDVVRGWG